LINGAGGSIGTYAVQIAKTLGAEVTCVDSAEKLDMLRSIGAHHVVGYEMEDFTTSGKTYDVIIDVIGKSSFTRSIKSLKPNGRYVLGNPSIAARIRGRWTPMTEGRKVIVALAQYKVEYYKFLLELMEAGKLKSIIDRRYPLEQLSDAHRYVEAGHKKGNVVITVG
jgi:NADPH:quinone reductase-like Zn-dependent oxidoreductase